MTAVVLLLHGTKDNESVEPEIKYKPVLWEFMDSSMRSGRKEDEYLSRLKECEICLVMFWCSLGEYTVEELEVAVAEMQAGRLPKKVLILFKETTDDVISPNLLELKKNYLKKYPNITYIVFSDAESLRSHVVQYLACH